MFRRTNTRTIGEDNDHKVIQVTELVQRLNRLMETLPGIFYLKFMPGTTTPRHVALIDGNFVPTSKQFGFEPAAPPPAPERTPMEKIIHGLGERQQRTITFDFIDGDDGIITLRTKDGQRTTLTPEQIDVILKEAPIKMFIAAQQWRQEEIDELDLDGMGYGNPRMTPEQAMEPNPIFADIPFEPAPGGGSYTYAREVELPKTIPYTVEPPETAAATFTRGERFDLQERSPLNLIREGREHEIGSGLDGVTISGIGDMTGSGIGDMIGSGIGDVIGSGIEEISKLPPRLVIEEPAPGEPGGSVPLPDGDD